MSEKFWSRVTKIDGGCWEWSAGKTTNGYGVFWLTGRKPIYAHRFSWAAVYGEPGQMHVLHHCDNPACVNPDHLFLGDHAANMQDCSKKGRLVTWGRGREPHWKGRGRKITRAIAEEIRAAKGIHREIAARYGLSQTTVSAIKRGDTWK